MSSGNPFGKNDKDFGRDDRRDNNPTTNHGILRQEIKKEQDAIIDNFAVTVHNISNSSMAISDRLDEHKIILEEFQTEAEETHERLTGASKYVDTLLKASEGNKTNIAIGVLIVILIVLVILAFSL